MIFILHKQFLICGQQTTKWMDLSGGLRTGESSTGACKELAGVSCSFLLWLLPNRREFTLHGTPSVVGAWLGPVWIWDWRKQWGNEGGPELKSSNAFAQGHRESEIEAGVRVESRGRLSSFPSTPFQVKLAAAGEPHGMLFFLLFSLIYSCSKLSGGTQGCTGLCNWCLTPKKLKKPCIAYVQDF